MSEGAGIVALMVDRGETTGGPEAEPGGAPMSTTAFSGYGGGPSTVISVSIDPTKMLACGTGPGRSSRWETEIG